MGGARRDSRDDRYEQHTLNTKSNTCRCSLPPRICWYKSFILVPFFTFPYFFDCTNKIHIYIYIYIYIYVWTAMRACIGADFRLVRKRVFCYADMYLIYSCPFEHLSPLSSLPVPSPFSHLKPGVLGTGATTIAAAAAAATAEAAGHRRPTVVAAACTMVPTVAINCPLHPRLPHRLPASPSPQPPLLLAAEEGSECR